VGKSVICARRFMLSQLVETHLSTVEFSGTESGSRSFGMKFGNPLTREAPTMSAETLLGTSWYSLRSRVNKSRKAVWVSKSAHKICTHTCTCVWLMHGSSKNL